MDINNYIQVNFVYFRQFSLAQDYNFWGWLTDNLFQSENIFCKYLYCLAFVLLII